ncbi:hypothetical protein DMZ43_08185 [Meridianimaribacter sp. CL38]|uniref:hypothetical protein n=1 Tax=Meridianimaribacter sp. CL38 TaxID=2213021 RepID=UPI00103E0981|nr:hypothetical protein [Meridianimaribacter sp. CL38]TBV25879.1 hypothetical protein DMZ43_08185 [Meridianimaribacter sp. CL38]
MNSFDLNDIFKKNVGEFILTFSEIEFGLGVMISYLENGIQDNPLKPDIIGLNLDDKRKRIRNGLKENSELSKLWSKIEGKISDCNEFRRLIAHGIVSNHLPNPSLQGLIKVKTRNGVKGFKFKDITNEEVEKKLKKLIDINSGKIGLGVLNSEIKEWKKIKSQC